MEDKETILTAGIYFPFLVFYFLLGIITRTVISDLVRHVIFVVLLFVMLFSDLSTHRKKLLENKTIAYYFLYFATIILLVQNIMFVIFHGFTILQYSLLLRTIELNTIDVVFTMYKTNYVLDLVGYSLLSLYMYYLETSESKSQFRFFGLVGSTLFVVLSFLWRLVSSFYVAEDFTSWLLNDFSNLSKVIFLGAQIALCLFWYSFWNLYRVNVESSPHPFLDNQVHRYSEITPRIRLVTMLLLLITFLTLFFINYNFGDPMTDLIRFYLLFKSLVLPFGFILVKLSIYGRYNLLF